MTTKIPFALAVLLCGAGAVSGADDDLTPNETPLRIITDFPNGSARVEAIDQETRTIRVLPASHPGRGWNCWWSFRVEGIRPGETITLDVGSGGDGFALPDQATYSTNGRRWLHTAPGERGNGRIVYRQQIDAEQAHFAWGPPFTLEDARNLVQRVVQTCPEAEAFELCRSREGQAVPALRIGPPDDSRPVVWVQARQHAWESGSSWVGRGLVEWLISDDPLADRLRSQTTFLFVPIMDVDNVQRGAGGKNQEPHDHNRDWGPEAVWPEVQAAMSQLTPLLEAGRLALFMDLHNPAPGDREPMFFLSADNLMTPEARKAQDDFLEIARSEMSGPLSFQGKVRVTDASYDRNWQRISKNWVQSHARGPTLALCLETSWNTPASTTDGYLEIGQSLGRTLARHLLDETP